MARSKRQRRFFGAERARKRAGERTVTGLSLEQIRDFAGTPEKGLPERAPKAARVSTTSMRKRMKGAK